MGWRVVMVVINWEIVAAIAATIRGRMLIGGRLLLLLMVVERVDVVAEKCGLDTVVGG